jgi:hypothetical protein
MEHILLPYAQLICMIAQAQASQIVVDGVKSVAWQANGVAIAASGFWN